jgi:hypothetical protein
MSEKPKPITVTREQVRDAKLAIMLSEFTGRPVHPAVLKIANARQASARIEEAASA